MDKENIINRIEFLRDCLAWSLQNNRLLTDSQRICLNQERAAWSKELTHMQLSGKDTAKATYTVPSHLEDKLNQIAMLMGQTNWNRADYEIEFKSF